MSAPIKELSSVNSTIHQLEADYRNRDKSCKNVPTKGSIFYQCITCDEYRALYICGDCKNNGNHEGHKFIEREAETVRFCDCGGSPGVYSCRYHNLCELPPDNVPIFCNQTDLADISDTFGLSSEKAIELCRLNQIRKVDLKSYEGAIIQTYFDNTNVHNREMQIRQCWSVYRKDQEFNFIKKGFDKDRRMLLWHGTKRQRAYGILSDQFHLPSFNGMFGRGIYFADRVSKSAQYCDESLNDVILLCEVAVGSMYRIGVAKHYRDAPGIFHSVKGMGKEIPDRDGETKLAGILVPSGESVPNPHPLALFSGLRNNEYTVYDPEKILIRYIIAFENYQEPSLLNNLFQNILRLFSD